MAGLLVRPLLGQPTLFARAFFCVDSSPLFPFVSPTGGRGWRRDGWRDERTDDAPPREGAGRSTERARERRGEREIAAASEERTVVRSLVRLGYAERGHGASN